MKFHNIVSIYYCKTCSNVFKIQLLHLVSLTKTGLHSSDYKKTKNNHLHLRWGCPSWYLDQTEYSACWPLSVECWQQLAQQQTGWGPSSNLLAKKHQVQLPAFAGHLVLLQTLCCCASNYATKINGNTSFIKIITLLIG